MYDAHGEIILAQETPERPTERQSPSREPRERGRDEPVLHAPAREKEGSVSERPESGCCDCCATADPARR